MTAPALRTKEIAFRGHTQCSDLIMNGAEEFDRRRVRLAAFHRDRSLPRRRENAVDDGDMKTWRDEPTSEPVEPGLGQKQAIERMVRGQLAQARWHVAANLHNAQILAQQQDLHFPARTRGGHHRLDRQACQASRMLRYKDVRGIRSLEDRAKDKIIRPFRWEIFQAVDRRVDAARQQCFLQLFDEKPAVNGARKAQIEALVSCRLDDLPIDDEPRMCSVEFSLDDPRLSKRQVATPRAENDVSSGLQEFSNTGRNAPVGIQKYTEATALEPASFRREARGGDAAMIRTRSRDPQSSARSG